MASERPSSFRVASGLTDGSGETEILAKSKKPTDGQPTGAHTGHLNKLFQHAFRVASTDRDQTTRGAICQRWPELAGKINRCRRGRFSVQTSDGGVSFLRRQDGHRVE
jgi:hypothetical protein